MVYDDLFEFLPTNMVDLLCQKSRNTVTPKAIENPICGTFCRLQMKMPAVDALNKNNVVMLSMLIR